jgi:hypothetical protein
MASSVTTYMHALRGLFRFAHIDGLIVSDPAVYARLRRQRTPRLDGRCRDYHAHSSAVGARATSGRVDRAGVPGSWLAAVEVR